MQNNYYSLCDIKVIVDYPQERQNRLGPYTFATDGTQLDAGSAVNCMIDPVTLSVFGTPLPMTEEWNDKTTPATGHYYRFQKSDFTFTGTGGSTPWLVNNYRKAGDTYIVCGSGTTAVQQAPVQLTNGVSRNEPLFFSYSKLQKKESYDGVLAKLFWANSTNPDKDTQLHFKTDGSCDVYRGYKTLTGNIFVEVGTSLVTTVYEPISSVYPGKFLTEVSAGDKIILPNGMILGTVASVASDAQFSLTANVTETYEGAASCTKTANKVQSYSRTESNYNQSRPISTTANPNDQYNDVYIIPCRGKELLILTSYGLNFSHSFDDLNVPDPPANMSIYNLQIAPVDPPNFTSQNIILPSGDFSIVIPAGKVQFQLAKLYFLDNWSIVSQKIQTSSAPPQLPSFLNGTLSCAFGSTEITGTGTSFSTQLSAGNEVYFYSGLTDTYLGTIQSVTNNTSAYLTQPTEYKLTDSNYNVQGNLTGTISVNKNSSVVTGTGTSFIPQLSVGDWIFTSDGRQIGQIAQEVNNTTVNIFDNANFTYSGTYRKNINQYSDNFTNAQAEFFSSVIPTSADNLSLNYYITNGTNSYENSQLEAGLKLFNNVNDSFKIKIIQKNEDDASSTASSDKGFMFYSVDDIFVLKNEKTSDSSVDITSAIEQMSIDRSETGQYTLNFSARKQLLDDLGMSKPLQTANRSVKVMLSPRQILITGTISKTGNTINGVDTLFTQELSVGNYLYLEDGTFLGIIENIASDIQLTIWSYTANTYIAENASIYPKYSDFLLYEGYLSSPEITYLNAALSSDNGYVPNYEKYALLSYSAIDKLQYLNKIYYSEAPNFDSVALPDIIETNIIFGGQGNNDINNNDLIISDTISTYQVPLNRNNSNGQYNFIANLGDNVGGYIEKLRSDYAQNFVFFSRPDWYPKDVSQNGWTNYSAFKFMDQDYTVDYSPTYSLFLNEFLATDLFGVDTWDAWKPSIRSLKRTYEAPEANRIYIVGLDKTNGSRLQYLLNDHDSQNPYTLPADRPTNWLGAISPFVMINDKLNTTTDVVQAANQFYAKLSSGRNIIEFEADLITAIDPFQFYLPNNRVSLSGSIIVDQGSTSVLGTSTYFTTELQVGDYLYLENGAKIGYVKSIESDSGLTLVNGSLADSNGEEKFFNDYTQYLEQYRYYDIGDIVGLYDEFGIVVYYKILSWSCQFIKETTTADYINARRAIYRAKQINYDPLIVTSNAPIFAFNYNQIPAANQWIVTQGNELNFTVLAIEPSTTDTITYTLNNEPTGMTIGSSTGTISWTPTSLQQNQIFEDIEVVAFDGVNSTSYFFSVRVYDTI